MDDQKKQFQEALKAELKPFFIGLRNDNKKLIEAVEKVVAKEPPKTQSVKVENPVKKIEITNHPESPRLSIISDSVVKMTSTLIKGLSLVRQAIGLQSGEIEKALTKKTLKVEVKNQIRPPRVQDVKVVNPPKEKQLQDVFIKNRTPKEAVPVVLTTETLKSFYTVISSMSGGGAGGGGKNLKDLFDILVKIDQNTDELELKTDQVNLNVDEVEARLGDLTEAEATGNGSINAILKRIRTLLAKIPSLTFIGDRLKVDAIITLMPDPRPGLRIAEFLESGGSSTMNIDGSVTPVTFSAAPPTGKKWFIHSVTLVIEDASINFTRFGGIPGGLTNGIEIRAKEGGLAEATLGTFKTNGDFHVFTTDIRIDSAATDFLTVDANIKENTGTTLELANANSEIFKIIVNDDLTALDRFNVLIKGFEVDE